VKRIVILGCAGSGKTTFAKALGAHTGLPVLVLDDIWQPQWTNAETPAFREMLRTLHAGEAWISDGNFARVTFDIRLPRADLIIWLDRPRWRCMWNAARRVFRKREAHRLGGLGKVFSYIWNFDRVSKPLIEATRLSIAPQVPVRHLRSGVKWIASLRR